MNRNLDHDHAEHSHIHHHDHRQETLSISWGMARLEAHTHEQAATVSVDLHPSEGKALPFGDVVAIMRRIAEEAEASGGVVGRVKAFARQGGAFAHASVTASYLEPTVEGDTALGYGPSSTIQLVAIGLLVDQEALLDICKGALLNYLSALPRP